MTQTEFLRQLKSKLRWQMPKDEVENVLTGYRDYFAKNEKAEEQLVAECGDIDLIVDELLTDARPVRNLRNRIVGVCAFWVFIGAIIAGIYSGNSSFTHIAIIPLLESPIWQGLFLLLLAIACFLIVDGRTLLKRKIATSKSAIAIFIGNIVVLAAIFLALHFLYTQPLLHVLTDSDYTPLWLRDSFGWSNLVHFFNFLQLLCIALSIAVCIAVFQYSIYLLPLIFLNGAAFLYLCAHLSSVTSMDMASDSAIDSIAVFHLITVQNFIGGIVLFLLSLLAIWVVRRVKKW